MGAGEGAAVTGSRNSERRGMVKRESKLPRYDERGGKGTCVVRKIEHECAGGRDHWIEVWA